MGMTIYLVRTWLDGRGFDKKSFGIEVVEKDKCYVGEGKRISKDKIMKTDTVLVEKSSMLRYHTYCLEGQQEEAFEMLRSHIIEKVKKYKEEIDLIYSYIA